MSNPDSVINHFIHEAPLKTKTEVLDLVRKSKINLEDQLDYSANMCLSVEEIVYGTLGNFTLLIGKAKSKKTFLASIIAAAACINGDSSLKFTGSFPDDKRDVIYIDTEQSEEHVQNIGIRISHLTNNRNHPNLHLYCLRPYSPETRRLLTSQIIELHPNAGLVVIDGARDLVRSVNDENEASIVANGLLKLSSMFNIHIVTVLHENKGNSNPRGHLGSELSNKAETVLSVKKQNNLVSSVNVLFSRKKPIPSFSFRINEEGLPELADHELYKKAQEGSTNNEWAPNDLPEEKLKAVLKEVSKLSNNKSEYNYGVLVRYLQDASEKVIFSIGTNRTKELLKELLKRNLIKKHGKKRSPNTYYTLEH